MPPVLLVNAAGAGVVSTPATGAACGGVAVAHAPQSASAHTGASTVLMDVIRSVFGDAGGCSGPDGVNVRRPGTVVQLPGGGRRRRLAGFNWSIDGARRQGKRNLC